ncbi:hypothetical protein Tco_0067528 [Tanacetum coccineum]
MIAAKGALVKRKPLNHTDYEVDLESRLVGDVCNRRELNDFWEVDYEGLTYYVCDGKKWISRPRFILKKICNEKGGMKVEEDLIIDARNGNDSLISHATTEEKVKLEQQRCKEEKNEEKEAPTLNVVAEDVDEVKQVKKKGRVSKRKGLTSGANTMSLKCMRHDRGWEEAASTISRAFIGLNTCNVALLEAADESWEEAVVKMLTYRRVLPLGWALSWT